jgi:predicted DNA-binding protein YlxM (UPF0122 family)
MARISKSQLIKLQKRYKTDDSIAALFGITRQAVHQLRKRYEVAPVTGKNDERDRLIARYYRDGMSGERLARQFALSLSQVYRITARCDVRKTNGHGRSRS